MPDSSALFVIVALLAIAVQVYLLILALFEPGLAYKIRKAPSVPLDSEEFCLTIEALCDARAYGRSRVEVLTGGARFYEAELEAIAGARNSVNVEAYIFQRGEVARRFVLALAERARAGVRVNLVLDAIGSLGTSESYFRELIAAGGRVAWYHPLRWHTLPRFNNRTHRELVIVDGEVGFLGGAGFADHWLAGKHGHPAWRDTMLRVEGDAVTGLQSAFAENWVEASGEILGGAEYFAFRPAPHLSILLVVNSSPSAGRSTRARILFQTLIASARESIEIATPYFLPDQGAREEMIRAMRERNVRITILAPGRRSDHLLTRRSSRRIYGGLLQAGARIFEYEPAMFHVKLMVVDGIWSVAGSTNFDPRSFGLNDEVNLAASDAPLARRFLDDFEADLTQSREVILAEWKRRPKIERAHEWIGWLFERQQ